MPSPAASPKPLMVPPHHVPAFEAIRDMPEEDFSRVHRSLSTAEATGRREPLDAASRSSTQLSFQDTEAMLDAIMGLATYAYLSRSSEGQVASRLASSPPLATAEDPDDELGERIKQLLECDAVRIHSKVTLLGTQHERIFANAQVLTDLRPLFKSDIGENLEPEGVLLSHTLSVHFIGSDGGHDTFFVVLDEQDIETLGELVDRARKKTESMRKLVKESGLAFLHSDE